MEHITSRSNALITRIRKLVAERKHRRREGVMVCEGPKMLGEALRWGAALDTVVWEAGKARAQDIPDGVRQVEVPGDLLAALAPTQTPQGVLFLCQLPERALPEKLEGQRYLVLDGVQDPGNVGTILRTADAFECDGVFLVNACADLCNPKTARATMGAIFRREAYSVTPEELFALLSKNNIPLYGTALREDTVPLADADLSKAAVAIGSEGRGLSQQMLDECAKTLKIPMSSRCESLNAAIAATVVLWEMYR